MEHYMTYFLLAKKWKACFNLLYTSCHCAQFHKFQHKLTLAVSTDIFPFAFSFLIASERDNFRFIYIIAHTDPWIKC